MKPYEPRPPSMSIGLFGEGGSGKSYLALDFPTPTVYIDLYNTSFDRAFPGYAAINKFAGDVLEMTPGEDFSKFSADYFLYRMEIPAGNPVMRTTDNICKTIMQALASPKINTIVIDGGHLLWRNIHEAHRERLNRVGLMWYDYVIPNQQMAGMYNDAKIRGKNLVTVHPMREPEVYGDDSKVVRIREDAERLDGWKYTPENVDIMVQLTVEPASTPTGNAVVRMRFHKNGFSVLHQGKRMQWPTYKGIIDLIKEVGLPIGDDNADN